MYPGAVRLGENLRQGVCRLFATCSACHQAKKQAATTMQTLHALERFPYFTNSYIESLTPGITQSLFKGYVFVNYLACFY